MNPLAEMLAPADKSITKMDRLLMSEVSGVDNPANQSPGWLVVKSQADVDAAKARNAALAIKNAREVESLRDSLQTNLAEGEILLRAKLEELAGLRPTTEKARHDLRHEDGSFRPEREGLFTGHGGTPLFQRHGGSPLPILTTPAPAPTATSFIKAFRHGGPTPPCSILLQD